tara:strand:+ start:17866 stop:21162 length:3297 start_codon:yes stop_codon:yes gene_type:complete
MYNIKNILILILLTFGFSNQWINIRSDEPVKPEVSLIESSNENSIVSLELSGFSLNSVIVNDSEYFSIKFPLSASIMEEGYPDLPKYSSSIIVPDNKSMSVEILSSNFIDYENINIIPSKGNLSRLINPDDIPYIFDEVYKEDVFYPNNVVQLNEPYILRDYRGQVVEFHPVQYNPVTKVLRVYTSIEVKVFSTNDNLIINPLVRNRDMDKIDNEYKNIYTNHFLNFENESTRFDYLVDQGNMLIISDGNFMSEMQPLVDWKNKKGIPTEIVNVSSIGTSASSISSFVENYYNSNGLTFLLLVGDIAQIPSTIVSGSASDVSYGCISGNDFYPEVIVGRMSGSTPSHIATQVERSIEYERYPQSNVEWYDNALGVASNQGPGFQNMTDDDFNDFLWNTILSDFTYDSYQGIYDGQGGSDAQGITAINNGVSLINYTGHGSISSWGNGASLSTGQINQLTNNNKLPFVITVGCNVGEFNSTNECYAEAWQRATNGGEPTGGIAHFGSTISQSWEPPMHGQYSMNLILTESYDNQLTRTMGGITTNGCMYMNDAQGSSGINETKYWTFFGDPSTNLRTAPAMSMNVQHDDVILVGADQFVVDVGENGALAALSLNGELISSAYSIGGVAVLELAGAADIPGNLDLVVTGFNSIPYEVEVMVLAPEGSYLVIDEVEVEYGLVDSGYLLYGRENNLSLSVSNVGSDAASDITVNLSSDNPYVNIVQGIVNYNNIAPNQSVEIDGLSIEVDWNVPNEELISMTFQITSNDDIIEIDMPFIAQSPAIVFNSSTGSLNPGETTDLNISLSNVGSAAINYPVVSLEGDMYVTVNNSGIGNAYYWDYLENNNQETLVANVTVSPSTPIGHVAELMVHVNNLNAGLDVVFPVYLAVGQVTENFESGFSSNLNWEFSGNQDWDITTTDQYEGFYSAQSGDINDNQTSQMSVTMDVVVAGNIEFYYRVASEYSPSGQNFYDGLEFYIDNQMVGQYQPTSNGQTPWMQASFPVQPGTHTFRWSYTKDGGGGATDMDEDCAWVDYISFPPSMLEDEDIVGDINGDGLISILDVVQVVNMVLGSEYDVAADVNGDGATDVLDVIIVVNMILGN